MIAALLITLTLFTGQAKADSAALPDTPQGKAVQAWIKAFNSGDEKTFLKAQDDLMSSTILGKRTPEERAKMFQRMKGDFGTMKVEKVLTATAQQIRVQVPTQDGATGTFTFDFEEKSPFKIVGIGIDVQGGGH